MMFLLPSKDLLKQIVAITLCSLLCYLSTANPAFGQTPKTFGKAPTFTLTDSEGNSFSSEKLAGSIWVANFFFTRCNGPCPIQTAHLQQVQNHIDAKQLQIISISADPEHDTPKLLKEFAEKHHVDTKNWDFLTGELSTIVALMNTGFRLGSGSEPIYHSSRLILVDTKGIIRGYYRGTEAPEVEKLEAAIAILLKE